MNEFNENDNTSARIKRQNSLMSSPLPLGPIDAIPYEVVVSRRVLLAALSGLQPHKEALTVIGAHAVIELTSGIDLDFDSTRDADLGVTPELLTERPNLATKMAQLGFERIETSRPGIYGLVSENHLARAQRVTIDLIAPEALAGKGSRSADVGSHGKSVTRAEGTELSTVDRNLVILNSFEPNVEPIEAYVAGHAAMICAKAYKLFDRYQQRTLDALQGNPQRHNRVRGKDAGDFYRLIATSQPIDVFLTFKSNFQHPTIGQAALEGYNRINHIYKQVIDAAHEHYRGRFDPRPTMNAWFEEFFAQ